MTSPETKPQTNTVLSRSEGNDYRVYILIMEGLNADFNSLFLKRR